MTQSRMITAALLVTALAGFFIWANGEPYGRIFWHLLSIHDLPAAELMIAVLLICFVITTRPSNRVTLVEDLTLQFGRRQGAASVVLWLLLCIGSLWVYRNHTLSMDEYSALFQARVFASGAMHAQMAPDLLDSVIPRGFQNHFLMVNRATGAVVSAYWPGFSLLLAPFVVLGVPWACNPTIAACSLLLIAKLAREVVGSSQGAGWAMLFTLASPVFIANGISFYSMPAHLLFNTGFALLLINPTVPRLFLAGVVGGYALVLHNPLPHLAFALPWLVWLALRRDRRVSDLVWLGLGYIPVVTVLGVGWSVWMRHILDAGSITAVTIPVAPSDSPSTIARVTTLAHGYLRFLHLPTLDTVVVRLAGLAKLWLWACPALLILAWRGGIQLRGSPAIALLGTSALTTFLAYFFISFDQGHGWGYRYFHSAWLVLPVLGAVGALRMIESSSQPRRMAAQLVLMSAIWLVVGNAQRMWQMHDFVSAHLAQVPPVPTHGRAIVFVRSGYYVKDLVQNQPDLSNRLLMFNSAGLRDDEVVARLQMPDGCKYSSTIHGWVWAAADAASTPDRTACSKVPG